MKSIRHLAIAGAALTAIVVVGALVYQSFGARTKAPDVEYVRLDGTHGRTSHMLGKVVLVNFWATDCVTCVKEMPQIVATHVKYQPKGFETLAIAMAHDMPLRVLNFTESRRLPFTVALDERGSLAKQFGDVRMTPTTFLINKRGEIVKQYLGEPDFAALHRLIDELLAET